MNPRKGSPLLMACGLEKKYNCLCLSKEREKEEGEEMVLYRELGPLREREKERVIQINLNRGVGYDEDKCTRENSGLEFESWIQDT